MKKRLERLIPCRTAPAGSLVLSLAWLAVLLLAGCGSSGSNSGAPAGSSGGGAAPAPTVTLSASPASVGAGGASALTVAATNASSVTLSGTDKSSYTLSAAGGTQQVTPAGTTTYTATATGAGGSATAQATVTVTESAPTVAITASPASIGAGGTSTLTVTAANATGVTLSGTDKSSYTLPAAGGAQAVSPAATTTYTATATGAGGTASASATVTVVAAAEPTVTVTATPASISQGDSSTLTVVAANAVSVTLSGDGNTYTLAAGGGTQKVSPSATATYTAEAAGAPGAGTASATAVVTVTPPASVQAIHHVIFMMQENHTFDNYFGMLNVYRRKHAMNIGDDGHEYDVDGIDDKLNSSNLTDDGVSVPLFKLKSSCIDDASSAWLESYGDVNRYDFLATRPIRNDGFVHTASGFANACAASQSCSGDYTDLSGSRAMGYYDDTFLNYYYFMASEFAVSDRWFSPIASKSNPNRIATLTGGTTWGLAFDPGYDDHVGSRDLPNIFRKLDQAGVSWKVYYTDTAGECGATDSDCGSGANSYPATTLGYINYTKQYLYPNPGHAACTAPTQPSSVIGDTTNYFCIDPAHVATLATYFTDLANGTLPAVSFIDPGYGLNDEHPGSFQPVLLGQAQMARILNAFLSSPEWKDSVFFFTYDEGGGPYDHVPPVPGHSNDATDPGARSDYPDIASISVSPDKFNPCLPPAGQLATANCDLRSSSPGANPGDAAALHGFGAQIGFRVPNFVISPFARRHYVSHVPMDHTAVIRFIEDRFIGDGRYLTARDAAQPNLLDFFDFVHVPWATPPAPPAPATDSSIGYGTCMPANMGP